MKPDWDKLMDAFADSDTALVADVDCTASGKTLCTAQGVKGYPTIKWGDPGALEDYKGGRDYDSLNKFAAESLKPVCSPSNVDLCDADKKAEIEKFLGMAGDELNKMIAESEEKMEKSEADFKASVELLQASYQDLMKKKDETQEEIKNSGLGLMKACKSHAAKATGSDEL
jgi:protein-disulfide isomerase-like protein with CxxC motif